MYVQLIIKLRSTYKIEICCHSLLSQFISQLSVERLFTVYSSLASLAKTTAFKEVWTKSSNLLDPDYASSLAESINVSSLSSTSVDNAEVCFASEPFNKYGYFSPVN